MSLTKVGMRTVKTAVAVTVCYLLFLPITAHPVLGSYVNGPFYACIAAIICMQKSVRETMGKGISRLLGTLLGGATGLACLAVLDLWNHPVLYALALGSGVIFVIWLCNTVGMPSASSIGGIVFCVVMLNHPGEERYLFTIARMGETAIGILVAILINRLLPDGRHPEETPGD